MTTNDELQEVRQAVEAANAHPDDLINLIKGRLSNAMSAFAYRDNDEKLWAEIEKACKKECKALREETKVLGLTFRCNEETNPAVLGHNGIVQGVFFLKRSTTDDTEEHEVFLAPQVTEAEGE